MELQISLRQRLPSRYWRKNAINWAYERSSAHEYDDNWLYDDILQVRIQNCRHT